MWDRITERARSIQPAVTAQRTLLAPFWIIGLLVGAVAALVWSVLKWVMAAIATGLKEATGDQLPHISAPVAAQWALAAAVIVAAVIWAR